MERQIIKEVKLMPRPAKLGVVCNLALPQLEAHDFIPKMPEKEEDPTQEFRKSRTKIAENRRNKNSLF